MTDDTGDRIREVADEHTVGDSTVVTISDPLNANAWIHATETVAVEP